MHARVTLETTLPPRMKHSLESYDTEVFVFKFQLHTLNLGSKAENGYYQLHKIVPAFIGNVVYPRCSNLTGLFIIVPDYQWHWVQLAGKLDLVCQS